MTGVRRIPVMQLSELSENSNKAVAVEGSSILVCRTEKGVFAVENMCSHMMATLEGGRVRVKFWGRGEASGQSSGGCGKRLWLAENAAPNAATRKWADGRSRVHPHPEWPSEGPVSD